MKPGDVIITAGTVAYFLGMLGAALPIAMQDGGYPRGAHWSWLASMVACGLFLGVCGWLENRRYK